MRELREREKRGARFELPEKPEKIEGFDDLVETLKCMVANEEERVRADLARNQTNLEILGTLQALIRKQGSGPAAQPVDLSPIRELVEEIVAEREARQARIYEFDIKRDANTGYAFQITATPKAPVTH
jgi:hypothetical protein